MIPKLVFLTLAFVSAIILSIILIFYHSKPPENKQILSVAITADRSGVVIYNSTGSNEIGVSETTPPTVFTYTPHGQNFVKITSEDDSIGLSVGTDGVLVLGSESSATLFELQKRSNGTQLSVYSPGDPQHGLLLRYKSGQAVDNGITVGKAEQGFSYYFDIETI